MYDAPDDAAPRLALATSATLAALTDDDRLALAPLASRGIHAEPAVWSDATVAWERYDAVVIRSCWDYFHRPAEFLAWLAALEARGVPVHNAPALLRWNHDKRYLRELAARGVAVPETAWLEPGTPWDLAALLAERGWTDAVVKPVVSGGALDTWRISAGAAADAQPRLDAMLARGGVMVQRYLDVIAGQGALDGEWSLLFFDGAFSHAVRKRPAPDDFRVQQEHGGRTERVAPPAWLLAAGRAVLDALPDALGGAPLYARVDGVVEGAGRFTLMELECLEPSLFLAAAPDGAERFADAVAAVLVRGAARA